MGCLTREGVPDPDLEPTRTTGRASTARRPRTGGTQTLDVTGTGRYVRMYGTARATPYGYSLWEFQVYGVSGVAGCDKTADAALNQPARASSVQDGVYPASYAFDGQPRTRWSSAFSDPQWIQVDLGSSRHICQVVLAWESSYATAYQIQTSTDAATWYTIYATIASQGGSQVLDVDGTGRFLRVYATARATAWGCSLSELTVHTSG